MPDVTEVFKTQGTPTFTYVSVSDGTYEKTLIGGICNWGTLCLITGPSKTGKTTLVMNVCSRLSMEPLIVRCNGSMSASDLWRKALEQLNFDRVTDMSRGNGRKTKGEGAVEGGIGWKWLAGLTGKVSAGIENHHSEDECRQRVLSEPNAEHLTPILRMRRHLLIVEDFHYLTPETQRMIFQEWKVFVDNEASVAVLGTTHHASDLAFANRDLIGRISHLQMTTWTAKDLSEIARKGFAVLNVDVDGNTLQSLADESVGLPILAQAVCLDAALSQGIERTMESAVPLALQRKDRYRIFHHIAKSRFGQFEMMYQRIARGMRRKKRASGGPTPTLYECLLSAFSQDPIVNRMPFAEIMRRLKRIHLRTPLSPTERSLKSSLTRLGALQQKIEAELLEWHSREETLYILEPSFLFYLRWRNPRTSTPTQLEMFREDEKTISLSPGDIYLDHYERTLGAPDAREVFEGFARDKPIEILGFDSVFSGCRVFCSRGLTHYCGVDQGAIESVVAVDDGWASVAGVFAGALLLAVDQKISLCRGVSISGLERTFVTSFRKEALYFTIPTGFPASFGVVDVDRLNGQILMGIFITGAEHKFLLDRGVEEFEGLLERAAVDPFHLGRRSVV